MQELNPVQLVEFFLAVSTATTLSAVAATDEATATPTEVADSCESADAVVIHNFIE